MVILKKINCTIKLGVLGNGLKSNKNIEGYQSMSLKVLLCIILGE